MARKASKSVHAKSNGRKLVSPTTQVHNKRRSGPQDGTSDSMTSRASSDSFMFVQVSGGPDTKPDPLTFRSLRQHVMHQFLDQKINREGIVGRSGSRPQQREIIGAKLRFRIRPEGLEPIIPRRSRTEVSRDGMAVETSAASMPGNTEFWDQETDSFVHDHALLGENWSPPRYRAASDKLDAFNCLPFSLKPGEEQLLDRFQKYQRWPWCPVSGQSLWSQFTITDELVFHASLYTWAIHFARRFVREDTDEWLLKHRLLEHKIAALHLINERLAEEAEATSDVTLAAVAALTTLEVMFGSRAEGEKHLDGLVAMVNLRGGINTLNTGPQLLIQRLTTWSDTIAAWRYGTAYRLPPVTIGRSDGGEWREGTDTDCSLIGLSEAELKFLGVPKHESLTTLLSIKRLACLEQDMPLTSLNHTDLQNRANSFTQLDRRLQVIVESTKSTHADAWATTVWRAVSLTELLYLHNFLAGYPVMYTPYANTLQDLRMVMEGMDVNLPQLNFSPHLNIWICYVGVIVSESLVETNECFLERLVFACQRWRLNEARLKSLLEEFIWRGPSDELQFRDVWQKIEHRL